MPLNATTTDRWFEPVCESGTTKGYLSTINPWHPALSEVLNMYCKMKLWCWYNENAMEDNMVMSY